MTLQQSKILVLSAIALFKRCADAVRLHNYSDKSMRVMQRAEARVMRRSRLNTQLFKQYQFLDSAELAQSPDSADLLIQGATYSISPQCQHIFDHAERCVLCGFFVDEVTEEDYQAYRVGG